VFHGRRIIYSVGMRSHVLVAKRKHSVTWGTFLVICALILLPCASGRADSLARAEKADSILILKKDHTMELISGGKVIRTYKIALGSGGLAPKQREGDARTPEGRYIIDAKSEHSSYHKALACFLSGPRRSQARSETGSAARRRHHDPWITQWEGMDRRQTPPL
jgi:hypothetical protein